MKVSTVSVGFTLGTVSHNIIFKIAKIKSKIAQHPNNHENLNSHEKKTTQNK